MSQYNSRIHIKVTDPSVWEKFKDIDDAEFGLAALAEEGCTSFVLDDWCCVEDEIQGIVSALAEGIDPITGELLPGNHVCNNADVVRALYTLLQTGQERSVFYLSR